MTMMDPAAASPASPMDLDADAAAAPGAQPAETEKIKREPGDIDPARANLVKDICKWARETREFRSRTFNKMRRDIAFVRPGKQWRNSGVATNEDSDTLPFDQPYEANLVQRHISQRVAALYAKNPKIVAKRRKRMDFQVWDGDQKTLREAIARASGSPGDPMTGQLPTPPMPTPEDLMLLQDVKEGMDRRKLIDRVGSTLEIVYTYFQQEGTPNFKMQAKQLIRRVETTGVGFVQLGFQRLMGRSPDIENRIRDDQVRLEKLERLAADIADQKTEETAKEIEELKLGLTALQAKPEVVLREGLTFEFPQSTDIIVDKCCTQLKGLIGAKRVAREYRYTKDQIKEIFGVDVGTNYTQYQPTKTWQPTSISAESNVAVVWAVWDSTTGLVYYVCDGYPDFLKEPEGPSVDVEGFFPFYVLTFNDVEDPNNIYPPSDVELLRPMQLEYNRSREGLREHRIANKPGYVAPKGLLGPEDKAKLQNHAANELIELDISAQNVKDIKGLIAERPTIKIDPTVYDTEYLFTDIQRVAGDQAANLGGTSGSTATEASIAETSRVAGLQSNIDDVDDFLSSLARAGGAVLLAELTPQTVEEIAGPGASWPDMSREEIAKEIYLEIEAGSSGRPNKALEIANMERMAPFLIQMPGLKQDWLLKQMMMRLDDTADITDAFDIEIPSIVAQNAITSAAAKPAMPGAAPGGPKASGAGGGQPQPGTGSPDSDPAMQGDRGPLNNVGVPTSLPGPKPEFPTISH